MLGCVETYPAEPYTVVGVQALVEELTQFFLRDGKCAGEDKNLCAHRKNDVKILYRNILKLLPLQGVLLTATIPRALPWARSFCPFRACGEKLAKVQSVTYQRKEEGKIPFN